MKDFMFSLACGCAVGGLILSISNLVIDFCAWLKDKLEEQDEKKNP